MGTMIFVRERRKIEKGEKKPRYRVCGVSGGDLRLYTLHMRYKELEQIAKATDATLVILEAGKEKAE
jgi:hypothetical protein